MNALHQLKAIQQATIAARQRLADNTLGTQVEAGRIQVVRVTYLNGRDGVVDPVSGWMPVADVCDYLAALK
jgi:hypothetical protein